MKKSALTTLITIGSVLLGREIVVHLPGQKEIWPPPGKGHKALSDHEYAMVEAAAAIIVPRDDAPGAEDVGVADYIDRMLAQYPVQQERYHRGLAWLNRKSKRQFHGRDFASLPEEERLALLQEVDEAYHNRFRPVSSLFDRVVRKLGNVYDDIFGWGSEVTFFNILKDDVFEAFYTSPQAWKMLGYDGPPQPWGYPDYQKCPPSTRLEKKDAVGLLDLEPPISYAYGGIPAEEV